MKDLMMPIKRTYELAMQVVLGSSLFELPILKSVKNYWYEKTFNGKGLHIPPRVVIVQVHPAGGGSIKFGREVYLGLGVFIDYSGNLTVGDNVTISQECLIYTHEHDMRGSLTAKKIKTGSLTIENEAWIGARAIILPSCNRVGEGAVIGAGSVVTDNVDDYAIVAGNPARKIGERSRTL